MKNNEEESGREVQYRQEQKQQIKVSSNGTSSVKMRQEQQQPADDSGRARDLKARIQLLQSKLHPTSSNNLQPDGQLTCGQRARLHSRQSDRSDSPRSEEPDPDSLSLASSSSSGSSSAPTPPPRLSSLQRAPEKVELAPSRKRELAKTNCSGDNECGPLVTHAKGAFQQLSELPPPLPLPLASSQRVAALVGVSGNMITGQQQLRTQANLQERRLDQERNNQTAALLSRYANPTVNQLHQLASHLVPHHLHQHANQATLLQQPQQPPAFKTSIKCFVEQQNPTQRNNYCPQTTCYMAGNSGGGNNNNGHLASHNYKPPQVIAGQQRLSADCEAPFRPDFAAFADPRRAPITKAVQNMVSQQQQQQATLVINKPSSRQPIRGCAPPPALEPRARGRACQLGSVSSASMSSISSVTSSASGNVNPQQQPISGSAPLGRPKNPAEPSATPQISSDSVQLLVSAKQQAPKRVAQQQQPSNHHLLMMQEPYAQQAAQQSANATNNHKPATPEAPQPNQAAKERRSEVIAGGQSAGEPLSDFLEQPARRSESMTTTCSERRSIDPPSPQAELQTRKVSSPAEVRARPSAGEPAARPLPSPPPVHSAGQDCRWLQAEAQDEREQQRLRQRQAELLQLVRLRQLARPPSSTCAQGLPTLQQLQEQIQRQRSQSEASPQQQRMQQWTAAAAALAQQQQQQQQQRRERTASSADQRSNAVAASASPLDMELEQTAPTADCITNPVLSPTHLANSLAVTSRSARQQQVRPLEQNNDEPASVSPLETAPQHNSLLTTAAHCERADAESRDSNMFHRADNNRHLAAAAATREPVPTPRANQANPSQQAPQQVASSVQSELSILTSHCQLLNPRLKDLSATSGPSSMSSAQSTPSHSILSDSTTLITEAAMNSSELIPKLIERLDRKLIVMKEEQLTLTREIELNESTGQRLFQSMKHKLTVSEYEKISLHANEIEKVTKLILSLKLRLKRVEADLKEKANDSERSRLSLLAKTSATNPMVSQDGANSLNSNDKQPNTSQAPQESSLRVRRQERQEEDEDSISPSKSSQLPTVRGVSDPTSTTGLPKRNHQHHASLQLAGSPGQSEPCSTATGRLLLCPKSMPAKRQPMMNPNEPCSSLALARHSRHQLSLTDSSSRSSRVCSPRDSANLNHEAALLPDPVSHRSDTINRIITSTSGSQDDKTASTSSDSIFNCADSAIGSTITGHGGSTTNIEQPTISQSSLTSTSSSGSSTHSSLASSSARGNNTHLHHHLHNSDSPSQSHLSSNISVSSHSSISSVPISPQLVSPASTTCFSSASNAPTPVSGHHQAATKPSNVSANQDQEHPQGGAGYDKSNISLNSSGFSALFASSKSDSNNNNSSTLEPQNVSSLSNDNIDSSSSSMSHLLTDTDILIAKRNKLVSQLEEAHQLEECIEHRNNIIIKRILKKYYEETSEDGEIAEFKQFTRLKSLLLKDSHDVADRIHNAELQLNELKQSSKCNV